MFRMSRFIAPLVTVAIGVALATPAVDAAPSSSASLAGTVFGASGAPLARAQVTAYALPGLRAGCLASEDEWSAVATVTTRTNGTYSIAGLTPGRYRVGVVPRDLTMDAFGYRLSYTYADTSADGTANVTSWVGYADDVTAPGPPVDVWLARPAAITGTITDELSGTAIPGIEVRAVTTGQWQRIAPTAITGADGRYRIAGLPIGAPDPIPADPENQAQRFGPVLVDPNGWYGVWLWWFDGIDDPTLDSMVDLTTGGAEFTYDHTMLRGGRLVVTVVDPAGRPVKGLVVQPDSAFPWPLQTTDAKGRVPIGITMGGAEQTGDVAIRVTDPAGRYRTTWSGGSPTLSTAQRIPVVDGRENQARIIVRPDAATLISSVAFWTGEPFRSVEPETPASVTLVLPGATANDWTEIVGSTSVHCDGTIEARGLWPGLAMDVLIGSEHAPQGAWTTSSVALSSGVNHVGTQRLPAWQVELSAQLEDGTPVEGVDAQLVMWTADWEPIGLPMAIGTTDENGTARVWTPFEPWGQMRLYVRGDGFAGYVVGDHSVSTDPDAATDVTDVEGSDREPFRIDLVLPVTVT